MKKRKLLWFGLFVVVVGVILVAYFSFIRKPGPSLSAEGREVAKQKPREKKTLYTCTMHPTYISDKPGDCPICGMKLVPLEKEEQVEEKPKPAPKKKTMYRSTMNPGEISDKPGKDSMGMDMVPFEVEEAGESAAVGGRIQVRISPERQQLIGVRTQVLATQPIHKLVRAVGRVDYVEPAVSVVSLKFEGWVETLFVDSTGKMVNKGDALFEIYSPELVSAQQEYLLAARASAAFGSDSSLLKSARDKLRLWDISDAQVEELGRSGEVRRILTIYAPRSGFVIEKEILLGQRIMAGESLYKIADLSKVWVYGEVYEFELPFIRKGQEVMASLSYYPGQTFQGTVAYIYPYLNPETRTVRLRVEVPNPELKLKPEMYADLEIHVDYGTKLAIPADAVINAGEKKIAFVDKGDGYLEPRELKLGVKGEDLYEVLAGVAAGEKVVISANFLVDSESSLKAALQQLTQGTPEKSQPEHKHD